MPGLVRSDVGHTDDTAEVGRERVGEHVGHVAVGVVAAVDARQPRLGGGDAERRRRATDEDPRVRRRRRPRRHHRHVEGLQERAHAIDHRGDGVVARDLGRAHHLVERRDDRARRRQRRLDRHGRPVVDRRVHHAGAVEIEPQRHRPTVARRRRDDEVARGRRAATHGETGGERAPDEVARVGSTVPAAKGRRLVHYERMPAHLDPSQPVRPVQTRGRGLRR